MISLVRAATLFARGASRETGTPFAAAKLVPTPKKQKPVREPVEKDKGFNESHGYGAGHGGPTGPGDTPGPAQDPAKVVVPPDEDDE